MGFNYWSICIKYFLEDKMTLLCKNNLLVLVMYFMYYIMKNDVINIISVIILTTIPFFKINVYVWPDGLDLQKVCILCFCLFEYEHVYVAIHAYYTNWQKEFCHWRLNYNGIVYIYPFRMSQYNLLFILKDIIISIASVSGADILGDHGIPFLQHMCKAYICQTFVVSF